MLFLTILIVKLKMEMLSRQNLFLVNASDLCKGKITRQRDAAGRLDISILDYVIVSEELINHLEDMVIDEERIYVLTKYASTKGVQKKVESDHNILFAKFNIEVQSDKRKERIEVFEFKNLDSQMLYFEETNSIQNFRTVFSSEVSVEQNAKRILQKMNNTFQKCFKKIRITGNTNMKSDIVKFMEMKSQLKIQLLSTEDRSEIYEIKDQIKILDNYLSSKCAEQNRTYVKEYATELSSVKGTFSQHGLWKLKSKL